MIIFTCLSCETTLRVMGDPHEVSRIVGKDSEVWQNFKCVHCDKTMVNMLEIEADPIALSRTQIIDLTPIEAFVAYNGMGLPSERQCSKEVIEGLFAAPVRKIAGQATVTGRYILESIEFWDGTKIHLGSSPAGAIVYRVTWPPNHTKEALNG